MSLMVSYNLENQKYTHVLSDHIFFFTNKLTHVYIFYLNTHESISFLVQGIKESMASGYLLLELSSFFVFVFVVCFGKRLILELSS